MTQVRLPIRRPATGTSPIVVFLHGAGENELSYVKLAECAAANGFIGVAISGPVRFANGGCCWPQDSCSTRDCIIDALVANDILGALPESKIFLFGFSQGATHAFDLVATYPDLFMGGVVLSPGDGPIPTSIRCPELKTRALVIAYGQREYKIFRKRAEKFAGLWDRTGRPCILESHPGGHHLPIDWPKQVPRWLDAINPHR